jgi:uncharacterized tellurite resistance protein B-like protein
MTRHPINLSRDVPRQVEWLQAATKYTAQGLVETSMIDDPINPRFEGATLVIETGDETEIYDSQFLVAALLVYVAKGDGSISPSETQEMLKEVGRHFHLQSAQSLELLNRAIADLADNPDLKALLRQLSSVLTRDDKRDIALMMLKVAAADGRKGAEEMEKLHIAAGIIDIPPDVLHQAFDDYFAETMT